MARTNRQMLVDQHVVGEEPAKFVPPIVRENDPRYGHALGWYNYYFGVEDMRDAIKEYIRLHPAYFIPNALHLFSDVWNDELTIGWCSTCELLNNGNILPESIVGRLRTNINGALKKAKARLDGDKPKPFPEQWLKYVPWWMTAGSAPELTIVQKTKASARRFIADIEMMIDMCEQDDLIDVYQYLTDRGVGGKLVNYVREFFFATAEELSIAYNEDDKQIVEGYRHFKKSRLLEILDLYNHIVENCDRYIGNKVISRKPRKARKKKTKSIDSIVRNVAYQQRDDELKIVSADPNNIPGAQQVWLYNTDKRTLTVLNAKDISGLSVKGTTINDFNETTSITVKLRKPAEVINEVKNAGKIALRNIINNTRAKQKQASGRLNKSTIILRSLR